jgi:hypothetical protein
MRVRDSAGIKDRVQVQVQVQVRVRVWPFKKKTRRWVGGQVGRQHNTKEPREGCEGFEGQGRWIGVKGGGISIVVRKVSLLSVYCTTPVPVPLPSAHHVSERAARMGGDSEDRSCDSGFRTGSLHMYMSNTDTNVEGRGGGGGGAGR